MRRKRITGEKGDTAKPGGAGVLFGSNTQVVSSGDGPDAATSLCYLYAWHRYRAGGESELWGQYHHGFRRMPEGWRITRLELRAAGTRNFHRDNMHPIGRVPPP